MQQHRLVVVGAGNITSRRHIPAFRASRRAEIVGVIDRHAERAAAVAQRWGLAHHGTSLDEAWVGAATAATVGVPPMNHAEISVRLLERGLHVLQEKPLAMSVAEGETIRAAAQRADRVFAVVHNFQFASAAQRLRRLLAAGALGEVRSLQAFQSSSPKRQLPVWAEDLPLGLFYDESPHLLYLLHAFGGDVRLVDAVARKSPAMAATPHCLSAHFDTRSGPAFLYVNFESCVSEWHFIVVGTKQVAVMDVFRDILVTIPNDGQHLGADVMRTSVRSTWTHWWGVVASGWGHVRGALLYGNQEVVRRFLDAIEGGGAPEAVSIDDGLAVLRMQHEIVENVRMLPA